MEGSDELFKRYGMILCDLSILFVGWRALSNTKTRATWGAWGQKHSLLCACLEQLQALPAKTISAQV